MSISKTRPALSGLCFGAVVASAFASDHLNTQHDLNTTANIQAFFADAENQAEFLISEDGEVFLNNCREIYIAEQFAISSDQISIDFNDQALKQAMEECALENAEAEQISSATYGPSGWKSWTAMMLAAGFLGVGAATSGLFPAFRSRRDAPEPSTGPS